MIARAGTAALALLLPACAAPPRTASADEAAWTEVALADARSISFGGEGEVRTTPRGLELGFGSPLTGVVLEPAPVATHYEIEAVAARLAGHDFFCGLTFPTAAGNLTLVLGGWGGALCGLSSLDGQDAANNATRRLRAFANGRDVHVHVRVDGDRIEVELDGEPFLACDLAGHSVHVRAEVEPTQPFGYCCYLTHARLSRVRWRPLPSALQR